MEESASIAIELLKLVIKYSPDMVNAIEKAIKGGATLQEAIDALDAANKKTAEDYLKEALAAKSS